MGDGEKALFLAALLRYTQGSSPGLGSKPPSADSKTEPRSFTHMPKRTFQPNRRHRAKTHGFRTRMKTKSGAAVLNRRRAKGRHKIAVSAGFRD